jgi:G:T-mismatch repair DNA endonuclease (very short patch repair protein)
VAQIGEERAKSLSRLERAVAEWLDGMGVEYLVKPKITVEVRGSRRRLSPDILVPAERLVIEVNGCYVHGCPVCYGDRGLTRNRDRDDVRLAALERAGYAVEVIWQHELPELTSAARVGRT